MMVSVRCPISDKAWFCLSSGEMKMVKFGLGRWTPSIEWRGHVHCIAIHMAALRRRTLCPERIINVRAPEPTRQSYLVSRVFLNLSPLNEQNILDDPPR